MFEFLDKLASLVLKFSFWIFWCLGAVITYAFFRGLLEGNMDNDGLGFLILIVAIWTWFTVRWIVKRYKGVDINKRIWTANFLLKNIAAPIIVSFTVFQVTGETSITLVSVPIIGLITASLNIG